MKQLTNNEIKNISGGLDKTYTCTYTHTSMVWKGNEGTRVTDNTLTTTLNVKSSAMRLPNNQTILLMIGNMVMWDPDDQPEGYSLFSYRLRVNQGADTVG